MRKHWILFLSLILVAAIGLVAWRTWPSDGTVPISTSSDTARTLFLRGRDLGERHQYDRAQKLLEDAITADPDFASAHFLLSRYHRNEEKKILSLERAIALAPTASVGEQLLIQASQAHLNRRPNEMGASLEKLVNAYPKDPRAHNEYGNFMFSRKNWTAAIEQYLIAIKLDPRFYEAYNGLGYSYRYQGNMGASESFFQKYIELLPYDPNPYDSYADLLTDMSRHEEAVKNYQKALRVDSGFVSSHLGIATNYNMLGRFAEARLQLLTLMNNTANPDIRHKALFGLATSYAFEGDLAQASREMQAACDLARESGDLVLVARELDYLGLIRLEAGLPDDAVKAFVQALQTTQSQSESLTDRAKQNSQLDHQQRMALVWLARGDRESAANCANKFFQMVAPLDDPTQVQLAHQTLGMVALASGQLDVAVQELSRSDLTHAYNQFHLALAFERLGDMVQALKYYRYASDYDQFDPLTHAFVQRRSRDKVAAITPTLRAPYQAGLAQPGELPPAY